MNAHSEPSSVRLVAMPPTTFDLMLQVTLDNVRLRASDPALQLEADLAQRAVRETAELDAFDPDLQLEAELARPRSVDPDLDVELDLYYLYDPDLEVEISYDDDFAEAWFEAFDPSLFVAYE